VQKKAKVHLGFDLNRSIPRKIFLSDGKGAGRDRNTARLTLGVGLAVSAFPLSVPV